MVEYNTNEVCQLLSITVWTLTNWYQWERKALESGEISERELPVPRKIEGVRGKPRRWTSKQVAELSKFQSNIVHGRNGRMGCVTNQKSRQRKK